MPGPMLDETALEIRACALESAILSLLRVMRTDAEGFTLPGELSLTVQATAEANGDITIDLAATLNERPVLGMSL